MKLGNCGTRKEDEKVKKTYEDFRFILHTCATT